MSRQDALRIGESEQDELRDRWVRSASRIEPVRILAHPEDDMQGNGAAEFFRVI